MLGKPSNSLLRHASEPAGYLQAIATYDQNQSDQVHLARQYANHEAINQHFGDASHSQKRLLSVILPIGSGVRNAADTRAGSSAMKWES